MACRQAWIFPPIVRGWDCIFPARSPRCTNTAARAAASRWPMAAPWAAVASSCVCPERAITMTTENKGSAIEAGSTDWADKHYLLVDDFIGIRILLRESLRNLGARHIDQAASGGEAMVLLAKTRYDVVLCDYNLGEGKNGQQVLEEARIKNLMLPSSVWLMVSAEKSVESVMGAAEHQPDAYIIKPITEGMLLTRLNRVWTKKQIFRDIDQAFIDKDYLRAAKLCDARIAG